MNNARLKILAPWTIYIKKVQALFDGDPQIACNVDYSGKSPSIVTCILSLTLVPEVDVTFNKIA